MAFNNNNTTTTGAHSNVPAGGDHKPTMGEKIGGTMDKLAGKLTGNEAKIAEGEAKKRGDTVGAQQADAAADAHKNTHGTTGNHGTHGAGVAGTSIGAGHHDTTHSHGTGLTGNNHGTTGSGLTGAHGTTGTGLTGDHHNTHTTGSGITGGTGLGHKAPGEPTMGDRISGNTQAATGRMTNDPVQYAQGQERKTDTSYGNAGGLGSGGVGATGAGLGGHGGHGVAGDTYGTTGTGHGLTGSHGDHSHHATGTGAGVGHNNYDNNNNNKASMGEKISGGMDKMVGKATNDPARVMQGEAKTQGHDAYHHTSGTAGGIAGNTTGYGTGTGAHHTGAPGTNAGAGTY